MTTPKKTGKGFGFPGPAKQSCIRPHGVGQITAVEEQEIAGFKLELYVVQLSRRNKMGLRPPPGGPRGGGSQPRKMRRPWAWQLAEPDPSSKKGGGHAMSGRAPA